MLYSRWTSFICLLLCCGLLGFAAYLQTHLGLLPCPLCVVQRFIIGLLGLLFLLSSLYTAQENFWRRFHSGLLVLMSLLGAAVAGRHVWLTMQPVGTVPTCGPSLDYMLQNLPWSQTYKMLLQGAGDGAKDTWQLLGYTLPQWTLLFFSLMALFGLIRFLSVKNKAHL